MINPFPNLAGFGLVSGLSGSAPLPGDKGFADRRSYEVPIAIESPVLSLLREMHAKYLAMRDVIAASTVTALVLQASDFAAIARSHPKIHAKLIAAVGESLSQRLRRGTRSSFR